MAGTYQVLSYRFRVVTDSPPVDAIVERTFGAFPSDGVSADHVYRLEDGRTRLLLDEEPLLEAPLERLVDHLLWHVHSRAYGQCDDLLLVHAGVVAGRGGVLVLPAASGSGKTTLTAGLVAAGLDYLSDEVAAFDPTTAEVVPVPAGLSVKRGSLAALADVLADDLPGGVADLLPDARPVPPSALRTDPLGGPGPLAAVVTPRYEAGATTRLRECSRATGLFDLATNGFNLEAFGRSGFELLAAAVRPARCYRLTIGDLDSAVAAVLRASEEAAREAP